MLDKSHKVKSFIFCTETMKSKNYIVISLTDGAVHAQKDISKLKNHTRKVVSTKKRKSQA